MNRHTHGPAPENGKRVRDFLPSRLPRSACATIISRKGIDGQTCGYCGAFLPWHYSNCPLFFQVSRKGTRTAARADSPIGRINLDGGDSMLVVSLERPTPCATILEASGAAQSAWTGAGLGCCNGLQTLRVQAGNPDGKGPLGRCASITKPHGQTRLSMYESAKGVGTGTRGATIAPPTPRSHRLGRIAARGVGPVVFTKGRES